MTERGIAAELDYEVGLDPFTMPVATHAVGIAPCRSRVVVEGRVQSVTEVDWAGGPVTEVALADDTSSITLVFFGDRGVGGVEPGRRLVAAGAVGTHRGQRVILSPQLWLMPIRQHVDASVATIDTLLPA